MKEIVEIIAKALVDHPDQVVVEEKDEERMTGSSASRGVSRRRCGQLSRPRPPVRTKGPLWKSFDEYAAMRSFMGGCRCFCRSYPTEKEKEWTASV